MPSVPAEAGTQASPYKHAPSSRSVSEGIIPLPQLEGCGRAPAPTGRAESRKQKAVGQRAVFLLSAFPRGPQTPRNTLVQVGGNDPPVFEDRRWRMEDGGWLGSAAPSSILHPHTNYWRTSAVVY